MRKVDPFKRILIGFVLILALFLIPTPYIVVQPGKVEAVKSMVKIEDGYTEEKGSLMLTTVRMTYSNAGYYLLSYLIPHADIRKKKDVLQSGETSEEYSKKQEINMLSSQSNAVQAAYTLAKVSYKITTQEVRIFQTIEGMPAAKILQAGDVIRGIDHIEVSSTSQLMDYISSKKVNDYVSVKFFRKGTELEEEIQLVASREGDPRPVIGVYLVNIQVIEAVDENKQIHVTAGEIGGPSAGLIFALEMYNRLVPEDITKGYQIAGTGTIDAEGVVGSIGGIQYKVVGADRKNADIFFTPFGNADKAIEQGGHIDTDMNIVPVKTMAEAIDYLASLPDK